MAALFQAAGAAVNTTTTTLSLIAPTILPGDLMFALIVTHDNTAITGQNARWQTVYAANNTAAQRVTLFVIPSCDSADSGATFNFTIAGTTAGLGRLYTWRGASGIGASSSSANASSATVTWATLQPGFDGSTIAAFMAVGIQTGSDGGISAGTNAFTARGGTPYNAGTTDASEAYSYDGPGATTTGARTMNNTSAGVNTGLFVEILAGTAPSAGGGGGGFRSSFGDTSGRNSGGAVDMSRGGSRGLASGLLGT